MLRHLLKTSPNIAFLGITELFGLDKTTGETLTEQKADKSMFKNETGWERVKRIFQADEFGNLSSELVTIINVGAMSAFVGMMYGGVMYSRVAYMDFIKNNQATAFNDHFEAKKKLQDKVTTSFGRGAWKWGWRLSLFCTAFTTVSTIVSEYKDKDGIIEYITAGVTSGFLYKLKEGPRAWAVGGGLGAVLGLCAGALTQGLLFLTGTSIKEVRYWQRYWVKYREDVLNKGIADYLEKEEIDFVREHNRRLGEEGKNIYNLDKNVNSEKQNKTE